MGYVETKCIHCGHQFKDQCNSRNYGPIIRKCPACREEYIDKRFKEVAITGLDSNSLNAKFYLKCAAFSLIGAIAAAGWFYWRFEYSKKISMSSLGIALLLLILCVSCMAQVFRIKNGTQAKENEKFMQESRERLRNQEYAQKLASLGYKVPEEFLR